MGDGLSWMTKAFLLAIVLFLCEGFSQPIDHNKSVDVDSSPIYFYIPLEQNYRWQEEYVSNIDYIRIKSNYFFEF